MDFPKNLSREKIKKILEKFVKSQNGELIDFDLKNNTMTFNVFHFTKYDFNDCFSQD